MTERPVVIETLETGPGAHTPAVDVGRQELSGFRSSTASIAAYTVGG